MKPIPNMNECMMLWCDTPDETEKEIEFPLHRYLNLKFGQEVFDNNKMELEGWVVEKHIGKYADSGKMTYLGRAKPDQKKRP
jgi:hypothetical protein